MELWERRNSIDATHPRHSALWADAVFAESEPGLPSMAHLAQVAIDGGQADVALIPVRDNGTSRFLVLGKETDAMIVAAETDYAALVEKLSDLSDANGSVRIGIVGDAINGLALDPETIDALEAIGGGDEKEVAQNIILHNIIRTADQTGAGIQVQHVALPWLEGENAVALTSGWPDIHLGEDTSAGEEMAQRARTQGEIPSAFDTDTTTITSPVGGGTFLTQLRNPLVDRLARATRSVVGFFSSSDVSGQQPEDLKSEIDAILADAEYGYPAGTNSVFLYSDGEELRRLTENEVREMLIRLALADVD